MVEWVAVVKEADLKEGMMKGVTVKGTDMLVVKIGGKIFALESTCPHAGGPLHEGELNDSAVTCPWHGSQFDIQSGKVLHGPATVGVKPYKTKVRDGKVLVEV